MWLTRIRRATSDGARACFVIVLVVAAVNLWKLAAGLDADPVLHRAGLSVSESPGILPGEHTLDPGDGYVVQALSRAAADSWLRGDVPYWNRFEGVGAPLAGEMQSMAFHPFVLLQRLPQGFLLGQILMESIAGIATLFFLRRLGIGRAVSPESRLHSTPCSPGNTTPRPAPSPICRCCCGASRSPAVHPTHVAVVGGR